MPGESNHQTGLKLFAQRQYEAASSHFRLAIAEEETCERWNDWATVELACGREVRGEWGYRRALHLDPAYRPAAVNLATLLIAQRRPQESVPILTPHAHSFSETEKAAITNLVMRGRGLGVPVAPPPMPNPQLLLGAFLTVISLIPNDDPGMPADLRAANRYRWFDSRHYVEECNELLQALPRQVQLLAIRELEDKSRCDYRLLLVLARHCLSLNDPQTALSLARAAIEVRPYDLHAHRLLVQAEVAATPEESRAQHPWAGLKEYLAASFCAEPWAFFRVECGGDVFPCHSGWLPAPIGNVYKSSPMEIWNSPAAQAIRKSILDGSFKYCLPLHCGRIETRTLPRREAVIKQGIRSFRCIFLSPVPVVEEAIPRNPEPSNLATVFPIVCPDGPKDVMLAHDATCNLACPQCRRAFHHANQEERERLDKLVQGFLSDGLLKNARSLRLNEGGEVFVSKSCRTLLKELKKELYPNLALAVITNGQLCNRRAFDDLHLWRRLSQVGVSIDAATEETYRVTRRGGEFKRLIENLEFLDSIRIHEGEKFELVFYFVVSALNFHEMPAFVELGKKFHAGVELYFLRNHGTFSLEEFKKLDISNPQHPDHAEFLKVLEAEPMSDPCVNWGSLGHLRPRHLIPCAG
jgi:hypothetical protein